MTNDDDDPKNELAARFEDRSTPDKTISSTDETSNTDSMSETSKTSKSGNSGNTGSASSGSSPGPDPDPDASRNRERIYMAVGSDHAEDLNAMYDRFDARSKLADEGGLEKHSEFWVGAAEYLLDHEDELAERLDVPEISGSEQE
jgi:hypothetical protein